MEGDLASIPLLIESPLCETCNGLDLKRFFREGLFQDWDDSISLGALTRILSNTDTCGLCNLISLVISRSWMLDQLHPDLSAVQVNLRVEQCGWADTKKVSRLPRKTECAHRIRLTALPIPFGIREMQKKLKIHPLLELQMMEDDAGRFGRERAFHGRRVGAEVSIKRIREWMQICETEHGRTCADIWRNVIEQLPQGMKMIDVDQMAIVEAPQNCRYIALSYVWGNMSTEYETRLENVAQRRKGGSLKNVELPRTILDAFKLVQELKERYLWVDALCIIQNELTHKRTQIAGMSTIYGAAVLTIFSAGGDSARAPLPGLEPGSRQTLQHVKRIQSLHIAVPLRSLHETLDTSVWNTRGWTFQEHLLSRRRLFFTNEQLFFECDRVTFCEDYIVESSTETGVYNERYLGYFKIRIQEVSSLTKFDFYSSYAQIFMKVIKSYTIRQLTKHDDIYNAVFALITVFSRGYERSPLDPEKAFLFGMPISLLEDAMLWQPALDAPAHKLRLIQDLVTPSWSWAGWMGGVVYEDDGVFMHGVTVPPLSFQWEKGSLVDEWVIGDSDGQAKRIFTMRIQQRPTYFEQVPVKYIGLTSPPSAPLLEGDHLAPGMLLFRTTAAFLRVRKDANAEGVCLNDRYDSKFHSIFEILYDTSSPATMGRIVLPTNTDTTELLEFVVLSRSNSDNPMLFDHQVFGKLYVGCILNVMAVRRVGKTVNGMEVSERFGVGLIVEAAWIAAGFKEQVVCLQ